MSLQTFEDLQVWKRAAQLAVDVCVAFKDERNFPLRDQAQRSAISIPSNIAEGAERDSDKDFIRFLRYAKSSAAELRTQLYIAKKIAAQSSDSSSINCDNLIKETREIASMLQGFINTISKRLK